MTGPPSPAKGKPQGVEIMLRSMGLGDVLDMSRKLASEGTVETILTFAKGLEALNAQIATAIDRLGAVEAALRRLTAERDPDPADFGESAGADPGPADRPAAGRRRPAAPGANGAAR